MNDMDQNNAVQEAQITEFELQLWRLFYSFLRWQEECEKKANGMLLSGNELAILNILKMNNRAKTLTDIERLLNRNDTHNIRYSLNKLVRLGLIKKQLSNFNSKNYLFDITEAGMNDITHFQAVRRNILHRILEPFDLNEFIKNLSNMREAYDEADRALTQQFDYANPKTVPGLQKASLGRILVVEDHPTAAKITKKILCDLNFQTDIASSGQMAIQHLKKYQYDIVFMDLGLPDMDGCAVACQIRAGELDQNNQIPIIGLTVHNSDEHRQKCLNVGMNAVFVKPLMKEKAQEIFKEYFPKTYLDNNEQTASLLSDQFKLPHEVIDLSLGAELVSGNKTLAREAIEMLIESFSKEMAELEKYCYLQDIPNLQLIIHKILGGVSYCGVPRLRMVCSEMNQYLKTEDCELLSDYLNLLKFELEQVKEKLGSMNYPIQFDVITK